MGRRDGGAKKMANVTPDDILKEIHDLKSHMQDESKSVGERLAETEKAAQAALDAASELRKAQLSPGVPMPYLAGEAASQPGGMFDGKAQLSYKRMLETPLNDPTLLPRDRERLATLHDMHTAMVIRFDYLSRKKPAHEGPDWIMRKMRTAPEFPGYANA